MPVTNPTMSFAARDLKYDRCPQSWKMMKTRTRNAPASRASGTTSHHETARLRYIKYQSSAYGPRVLTICQSARASEGCWYFATTSFQTAVSVWHLGSLESLMGQR